MVWPKTDLEKTQLIKNFLLYFTLGLIITSLVFSLMDFRYETYIMMAFTMFCALQYGQASIIHNHARIVANQQVLMGSIQNMEGK